MSRFSYSTQAMLFMLLSMFGFSVMNIIIRDLSGEIHAMQMVMVRNVMSVAIVIAYALLLYGTLPSLKTERIGGHMLRALSGLIAMQLWFYSVTIMPVTLATALSFTTPIFATLFAILWLGERAGIRRWVALFVSFIGVLLIANPDTSTMDTSVLVVLAASASMAVAGICVKILSRTESPETIVFYMALFMTPLSLPLGIYYWQPMEMSHWYAILGIAFFSTSAQLMMVHAFKRVDMVVLMPLDFTRLIFTAMLAYVVFDEWLDTQAWIGAGIIVASSVYIAYREALAKKHTVIKSS